MNLLLYWIWILFTAFLTIIAPICVQHFINNQKIWYFMLIAIICNALMVLGYYMIFQKSFTGSFTISKILSVILIVFYGLIVFKEKLLIKNYIGIALALITIYLLQ